MTLLATLYVRLPAKMHSMTLIQPNSLGENRSQEATAQGHPALVSSLGSIRFGAQPNKEHRRTVTS